MKKHLSVILLIPAALTVWLPVYLLLTGVFMDAGELAERVGPALTGASGFANWPILPRWPTLRPLTELLLDRPKFFVMFWNSCALSFPALILQLAVAAPAAWALTRYRFRGRGALCALYAALMLMPFQVMMAPNYLALNRLSLLNTRWAVVLPSVFSAFPVFILQRFFAAVPEGFLEAAQLDGANALMCFTRIGLPLGAPGILAAAVLGFLENWSAIEQPLSFLRDQSLWPLSLFLSNIAADDAGSAFSASLIAMLPAILIFLWGQPYLESGIRAAGLKE